MRFRLPLLLSLASTLLAGARPAAAEGPAVVRLEGSAFGFTAIVEVRGLSAAEGERAAQAAFTALAAAETDLGPGGGLARLAERAGEPVALPPPLLGLVAKAVDFCVWSEGRIGLLGGHAYDLWGLHRPVRGRPPATRLEEAAASAACDRLQVDAARGQATLAPGSRPEAWGLALGWAVDRAGLALAEAGAANARVELGGVLLGIGPGPSGRGWEVAGLRFPGQAEPLAPVYLRDRALAVVTPEDRALAIGGDRHAPYLDLRTGRPAAGAVAVLASSPLALDAQAVAVAMFVAGPRQGQYLAGPLRPSPAVLWLLGSGEGEPLFESSRWSDLRPR
ncbi:MAG: FAD:protein FMN transferase [Thermoanaerobaculia bacterium]|nr:FAD:protein FMN transferase [Thermoanaerobaculia bacterium]